jgi:hypothetical protein
MVRKSPSSFCGPIVVPFAAICWWRGGRAGLVAHPLGLGVTPDLISKLQILAPETLSKNFVETNAEVPDILRDLLYGLGCTFR